MKSLLIGSLLLSATMLNGLAVPVNAAAQDLKPVYDGRLSLKPTKLSAAEDSLVKEKVLPAARKLWLDQELDGRCTDGVDPAVLDVANGSFTRPGSDQRAILYRYCVTGHNMALNGIAIIEKSGIAAHIVYEGDWSTAIGALPDLNGNGLTKILIASGGTNQGVAWSGISIIEISGDGVTALGSTMTGSDDCGANENNCRTEAHRIFVKAGKAPVFFKETFTGKSGRSAKDSWKKSGAPKEIPLQNDETEYQLIH